MNYVLPLTILLFFNCFDVFSMDSISNLHLPGRKGDAEIQSSSYLAQNIDVESQLNDSHFRSQFIKAGIHPEEIDDLLKTTVSASKKLEPKDIVEARLGRLDEFFHIRDRVSVAWSVLGAMLGTTKYLSYGVACVSSILIPFGSTVGIFSDSSKIYVILSAIAIGGVGGGAALDKASRYCFFRRDRRALMNIIAHKVRKKYSEDFSEKLKDNEQNELSTIVSRPVSHSNLFPDSLGDQSHFRKNSTLLDNHETASMNLTTQNTISHNTAHINVMSSMLQNTSSTMPVLTSIQGFTSQQSVHTLPKNQSTTSLNDIISIDDTEAKNSTEGKKDE